MRQQDISKITVSIVLYKNKTKVIKELCESLSFSDKLMDIHFVDNSPTDRLKTQIEASLDCHYTWMGKNIGFGPGHNSIMDKHLHSGSYHLVLNPDVYYDQGTIERIMEFMDDSPNIGLLLPRVLNPNGTEQPLYKLLPSPVDLIIRRFIPAVFSPFFESSLKRYRMAFADVTDTFDAPYLSGCFMFIRKKALKEIGLFDTRFFLYCEDVDLSRRIRQKWRTVYNGSISIYHYFQKGSYHSPNLLFHHVISAVKYFSKHGWFYDKERTKVNLKTLESFPSAKKSVLVGSVE